MPGNFILVSVEKKIIKKIINRQNPPQKKKTTTKPQTFKCCLELHFRSKRNLVYCRFPFTPRNSGRNTASQKQNCF